MHPRAESEKDFGNRSVRFRVSDDSTGPGACKDSAAQR